jgi:hypothetical protein
MPNNRAAPEFLKMLAELQNISKSGERDRWAALVIGGAVFLNLLVEPLGG